MAAHTGGSSSAGGRGGRGLRLAAARAHPMDTTSRSGGRRWPSLSPPLLGSFAARSGWWGWRTMAGVGVGAVGGRAGVGQADLAAGGQGAVGLAGLLGEQAATFGGPGQAVGGLVGVEGAGGDQ